MSIGSCLDGNFDIILGIASTAIIPTALHRCWSTSPSLTFRAEGRTLRSALFPPGPVAESSSEEDEDEADPYDLLLQSARSRGAARESQSQKKSHPGTPLLVSAPWPAGRLPLAGTCPAFRPR